MGVFNSAPQERFLDAVNQPVVVWTDEHLIHFSESDSDFVAITVGISAKGDPISVNFFGIARKPAYNPKKIYIKDIFPVVRSASRVICF